MTAQPPLPVCYRHPDRETRLGCSSCARPICVECTQRAAVGQLCPDCVAERGRQRTVSSEEVRRVGSGLTPASLGLLSTCVAIFIVGAVMPGIGDLLFVLGAQFNRAIASGQWWRLLSAGFLHADFAHIMFNMLALYVLGPQLERQVGSIAFTGLYLASMVTGGVAFFLLSPAGTAVGASGAIFGLFGAWLAVALRNRHSAWGRSSLNQLLVLLGINLALPLFIPRIAWEAHVGGLLAGLLIAWLWTTPGLRGRERGGRRAAVAVGVAGLAVVLLGLAIYLAESG